jgi:hypothetical protein
MKKLRFVQWFQGKLIRLTVVTMTLMSSVYIAAGLVVMSVNVMLVIEKVIIEIPKLWLRKPF